MDERRKVARIARAAIYSLCLGVLACSSADTAPDERTGTSREGVLDDPEAVVVDEGPGAVALGVDWTTALDATREQRSLAFIVRNDDAAGRSLTFALQLEVFGLDDRTVTRDLGSFKLVAREELRSNVNLAELPMRGVSHATGVRIKAILRTDDGVVVAATPQAFVHFSEDYARAWAYDYDVLLREHDAGHITRGDDALRGRVGREDLVAVRKAERAARNGARTRDGDPDFPIGTTFGAKIVTDIPSDTPMPGANDWFDVTAFWTTSFLDASSGSHATSDGDFVNASYAKAEIRPAGFCLPNCPAPIWTGTLDKNGHLRFNPAENEEYVLVVHTELARYYPGFPGTYATAKIQYKAVEQTPYVQKYSRTFKTDTKNAPGPLSNFALVDLPVSKTGHVASAMSRAFAMPDNGIVGGKVYDNWVGPGAGACIGNSPGGTYSTPAACNAAGGNRYWSTVSGEIYTGNSGDRFKNVIAHEIGHQVQGILTGMPMHRYGFTDSGGSTVWGNYDHPNAPTSCRCDHVQAHNRYHCLQSVEVASAAGVEGWAHFVGTKIWAADASETATYNYYKEFRHDNGTVSNPPYKVNAHGTVKWTDTHWPGATAEGGSTEYDWFQFLWGVNRMTANKSTMSQIKAVYQKGCGGSCSGFDVTWPVIASGAAQYYGPGTPKYEHIMQRGADCGVKY